MKNATARGAATGRIYNRNIRIAALAVNLYFEEFIGCEFNIMGV